MIWQRILLTVCYCCYCEKVGERSSELVRKLHRRDERKIRGDIDWF